MICHRTSARLTLLCGGELGWRERLRTRWHLRRCARCRNELAELAGARVICQEAMWRHGVIEPDDNQWERVRRRIALLEPVRPPAARRRGGIPHLARIAGPACGIAVLLFLALHDGGDAPHRPPARAAAAPGPTIDYVAAPGTTVMTFQTADPHVAICWFFSQATTEE